jgi:beta-phosphoglucomutase family hydrolase
MNRRREHPGAGRAVIFDMDGVLADTGPWHERAWQQLAAENGLSTDRHFFARHFGQVNRVILPALFQRDLPEEEIRRLGDRKEKIFRELYRHQIEPLPGVAGLGARLLADGFLLAVGSSGPRDNVEMILEGIGLAPALAAVVTSEDVSRGKPDPEVFIAAATALRLPPGRCVVVEDAVVGVQAALAAGMPAVAVTNTHPARSFDGLAHLVVDSLEKLTPNDFTRLINA